MTKKTFYVSTPIYYCNDVPHIGHAYTTINADVLARYHRLMGEKTFFLTGTDEHGQKVETAAQKLGKSPKAFADDVVQHFRDLWKTLNISNDRFIRTTDDDHAALVSDLWKVMVDKGDIYLGEYEDWYCVHDETFWTESQLLEGNLCPNPWCKRPVQKNKEKSYFFKLSKYTQPLLDYYEAHPDFVLPGYRMNEVKSFVSQGLNDLSISRTSFSWGIPVPGDPAHVMYVWLDALANYLTGCGYKLDDPDSNEFWPATIHLIGKDILRFHAIFWPAFLMSAGIPLPEHVLAHGFWTIDGQKMSKSLGNFIRPTDMVDAYGLDPVRYFLLREISLGPDGDFSETALVGRLNSDLANDLGNLLSRSLAMTKKYLGGVVPEPTSADSPMAQSVKQAEEHYHAAFKEFQPNKALLALWEIIAAGNKYVDERAPWVLAKDESKKEELAGVMYDLLEALRHVAILVSPIMPTSAEKMLEQLGMPGEVPTGSEALQWGGLSKGLQTQRGKSLFPRVELAEKKEEAPASKKEKASKKADPKPKAESTPEGVALIEFEDFSKLQMKVGKILSAEPVPKTDKLMLLSVDIGEDSPRTIVAGIAAHYTAEQLVEKCVIVLANLKPRKLRGIFSEGMLLAATAPDGTLRLLTTDGVQPAGSRVG